MSKKKKVVKKPKTRKLWLSRDTDKGNLAYYEVWGDEPDDVGGFYDAGDVLLRAHPKYWRLLYPKLKIRSGQCKAVLRTGRSLRFVKKGE